MVSVQTTSENANINQTIKPVLRYTTRCCWYFRLTAVAFSHWHSRTRSHGYCFLPLILTHSSSRLLIVSHSSWHTRSHDCYLSLTLMLTPSMITSLHISLSFKFQTNQIIKQNKTCWSISLSLNYHRAISVAWILLDVFIFIGFTTLINKTYTLLQNT